MKKRSLKFKTAVILFSLLTLIIIGYLHCIAANDKAKSEAKATSPSKEQNITESDKDSKIKVRVKPVELKSFEDYLDVPGTVEAFDDIEAASDAEGIVSEVFYEEGDIVEKGKIILCLDRDILSARIKQAEAALTLAQDQFKRINELKKQGVASI